MPEQRRPLIAYALLVIATLCAAATAHLLALLLAAVTAGRRDKATHAPETAFGKPFLVLVPAHDEELVIGATLAAVGRFRGPEDAWHTVVIADNCTDSTAPIAAAAGAVVLERVGGARTKGAALDWALNHLRADLHRYAGVMILDADTPPSGNLLMAVASRMRAGARIVQAHYEVSNPEASSVAGLRDAGFRLTNWVRPMGRDALGLSAGLHGTGMTFHPEVLEHHGWRTSSLIEDMEQHLRLVAAGERVVFAPEATVRSPMPTSFAAARSQVVRWEGGRSQLVRRWGLRLLRSAVRRRDPAPIDALLDVLLPSQSLLLPVNLATIAASAGVRAPRALAIATGALIGQGLFVVGGLKASHAPAATWRALLAAPTLVAQKLSIRSRLALGRTPEHFVRTRREAPPADA